ncbi:hypothetical protein N7481_003340 [Penicillium waksmanii]|uniref:uncharacterized protein n=1 Tax=Penicillium waksmanii TaxID=69791 RepID=UPI0025487CC2|nr:uncharacterized protein N7481_003340 [Penicillium waksmanii]KAJ5988130.1 hypothetical protein N7481_003340 [Penicillium waksmanii]
MAAADPPAGLLDIARFVPHSPAHLHTHAHSHAHPYLQQEYPALTDLYSTLSQDEIPFKLRCAICNKLAVNAFRLPCCDQSICEACQTSLSDTCPVCAHDPVSPDLCKPNKALRTTLKVFLRTEEKKREKERQSAAATPTPAVETPAPSEQPPIEVPVENNGTADIVAQVPNASQLDGEVEAEAAASDRPPIEHALAESRESNPVENNVTETAPLASESEAIDQPTEITPVADEAKKLENGEDTAESESVQPSEGLSQQPNGSMMNMGQGGFQGMGWNGMNPFMSNMSNMFNFQNPMGMHMSMDPMTANQGMFGDYGMNMAGMGMGMGMGMNYNGQGMYGSSGWDGSWQNGQDNYNPNAFANGGGPHGAFGGSNMSYPSNPDYQSGYSNQGYGRGGYRGGRGGFQGPARGGGFASGHAIHNTNAESEIAVTSNGADNADNAVLNGDGPHTNGNSGPDPVSQEIAHEGKPEPVSDEQGAVGQQLQGIPTIESLDQSMPNSNSGWQAPGYGRGGFQGPAGRGRGYWGGQMPMNGGYQPPMPPKPAPVVEGAPAAPRGMRQGLPNTSMLRQRAFHQGRGSGGNKMPQPGSKSRSPSQARSSRARSPAANPVNDDEMNSREPDSKRNDDIQNGHANGHRSSGGPDRDIGRGRRDEYRPRRSHGHRSRANSRGRSRSHGPGNNGDSRHSSRLPPAIDDKRLNKLKETSETRDSRDLASRVSSHRSSKERSSRRDEDRERERDKDSDKARPSRRRDRDRDRGDRRDRDRDSDRDRRRDRDRESERDRLHQRDRDRNGRDRERDRKRSRRDRSESANASDHSSRPQPRRPKREPNNDRPRARPSKESSKEKPKEAEKDPYTLAREAANRERVLREQQNRGAKSAPKSGRRDSRQERVVGGRRLNYKYEDEL